MVIITALLSILAVLSGILMVFVILLQNNKGGGGLGAVSGGVTETMFGTSASSALLKITVWLAVIFMGSTLVLATVTGRVRGSKSIAETIAPAAQEASVDLTIPAEAAEAVGNAAEVPVADAETKVEQASENSAAAVDATLKADVNANASETAVEAAAAGKETAAPTEPVKTETAE